MGIIGKRGTGQSYRRSFDAECARRNISVHSSDTCIIVLSKCNFQHVIAVVCKVPLQQLTSLQIWWTFFGLTGGNSRKSRIILDCSNQA